MVDYPGHYRQYELCLLSPLVPGSTRTTWEQVQVDTGAMPLLRNNKLRKPLGGCQWHAQGRHGRHCLGQKTSLFSALEGGHCLCLPKLFAVHTSLSRSLYTKAVIGLVENGPASHPAQMETNLPRQEDIFHFCNLQMGLTLL